jgi:peptide/nickel transport system permease protein
MVLFWLIVGLLSLVWTPYDPNSSAFAQNLPPNGTNWLGTDHLGRDILSRLMTGTQVILLKTRLPGDSNLSIPGGVAIWGVLGSLALGSLLGLNAGYRSGWSDQIIMQVLDALIAFPRIVLYLVVIAALGRGDLVVIFAIAITGAPGVARLARSLALDIKTRDYIRAAETRGENVWFVMFREILPNARGPLLVDAMLRVGYAIFAIGTLGFLGIGLPPPDPDWGNMVNEARRNIFSNPLAVVWPALAISTLVIGLNLFADGLSEEMSRYQR